ncbi:3'-5' exonuclease [Duganella radicis]|uniref:3'-5' exonuclease n=1 Tax=Duganella radicis TaxID=551988 RepID=A0A6L6PPY4_9BURK|nr:3'-5' exonuclease [Duganella radicis]MTV40839.1 3'-5' exonuclease [Duganella radicis]
MLANILVIDLEATCADDGSIPPELMETLEIGSVWIAPDGQILDRFQSFVRPIERPRLTAFCKRLLPHIDQAAIDAAPTWPAVAARLAEFAQRHQQPGSWWGSWGAFDHNQIERESARHRIADPLADLPHENLKRNFARARRPKIKQCGMIAAMKICNLTPEGHHHRALDDGLNIARLLPFCPRPDPAAEG